MVEAEDEVVLWGERVANAQFLYVDDCVDGLVLATSATTGPSP